ncbi:MAG TPA: methylmalonyl-CoA mutase family protein, partial [Gammaproteobacteria bacterium]
RIVGVNCYQRDDEPEQRRPLERPEPASIQAQLERLASYKAARAPGEVQRATATLAAAADDPAQNLFGAVVDATRAGLTQGEIVSCLHDRLGFGRPLVLV